MRDTGRTATEIVETAGLGVRRNRSRKEGTPSVVVSKSMIELLSTYEGTSSLTSIAHHVGVTPSKLRELMDQNEELMAAVLEAQRRVLSNVENSLYKRAIGYEKTYAEKRTKREWDAALGDFVVTEVTDNEKVVVTPPDITAIKTILTNRDPDNWSDKQKVEIDGGLAIALRHAAERLKLVDLRPDEWEEITDA